MNDAPRKRTGVPGRRFRDFGTPGTFPARNAPRARSWRFPEPIRFGDNAPARLPDDAHGTVRSLRESTPREAPQSATGAASPNPVRYAIAPRGARHVAPVARPRAGTDGYAPGRCAGGFGKVAVRDGDQAGDRADRDGDRTFADRLIRSTRFNVIQPDSPKVSKKFGGNLSGNVDLGISRFAFQLRHLREPFPRSGIQAASRTTDG